MQGNGRCSDRLGSLPGSRAIPIRTSSTRSAAAARAGPEPSSALGVGSVNDIAQRLARAGQGADVSTIHLHHTTTATPEQVLAGLTDFGPGRSKLFGNSADGYLKVHDQGPGHADVTEGSRGIWERLRYDWSDPNRVVMTTTDSNLWGGASGHTYTFTRQPNGTTDVDVVVVREGKNFRGRVLAVVVGVIGKSFLGRELGKTVKAIEARNGGGSAPG